jgi:hypothetical protein
MAKDTAKYEAKFNDVLRRILKAKPQSKAEIRTRIKAERAAKIVQKRTRPNHRRLAEE